MIPDRSLLAPMRRPLALALSLALLAPGVAIAQAPAPGAGTEAASPAEPPILDLRPGEFVPDADAPVRTLAELVELAGRTDGNLNLVVLREQLELANVNVTAAWASLLPVVRLAGSYTRNSVAAEIALPDFGAGFTTDEVDGTTFLIPNQMMQATIQPLNQWGAQLEASMPLLAMPAYYGIANARQAVELTEKNVTFARNEVIFSLSQAYYGAVASRRIIEVAAAQLQTAREQERVAQARFEVGESPRVEYLRAAVQRARFEQDLIRAQNGYVSAKLAIAQLVGLTEPFSVEEPPAVPVPAGSPDELVRAGLAGRRDLQAQRDAVEIAERALKANYWQFAPVIAANGAYRWTNVPGFTGQGDTWAVTISAVFTIFDYTRYADIDRSRSQVGIQRAERDNLARTVAREVRTALLDLESAQANLVKAEEGARLAAESAGLVRAQYEAGAATYLDVTDAAATEFAAQVSVVTERLNTQVAALRLSRSIGKFGVERFP